MNKPRTYLGRVSKEQLLSMGQVADLCGVAPRTASKWFDKGLLNGHRLPLVGKGGGDRRVKREEVLRFMVCMGFPIPDWLAPSAARVVYLFGTNDQSLADALTMAGYQVTRLGSNLFDLGVALAKTLPDLLVLDGSIGRSGSLAIIRKVRLMEGAENETTPKVQGRHPKAKSNVRCQVVVLTGDDDTGFNEYLEAGADRTWPQSSALALVAHNQLALAQKETP